MMLEGPDMSTLRLVLGLALTVSLCACQRAEDARPTPKSRPTPQPPVGRYQIVQVASEPPWLLDTATGAIWASCSVTRESKAGEGPGKIAEDRARALHLSRYWCAVAAEALPPGTPGDPLGLFSK